MGGVIFWMSNIWFNIIRQIIILFIGSEIHFIPHYVSHAPIRSMSALEHQPGNGGKCYSQLAVSAGIVMDRWIVQIIPFSPMGKKLRYKFKVAVESTISHAKTKSKSRLSLFWSKSAPSNLTTRTISTGKFGLIWHLIFKINVFRNFRNCVSRVHNIPGQDQVQVSPSPSPSPDCPCPGPSHHLIISLNLVRVDTSYSKSMFLETFFHIKLLIAINQSIILFTDFYKK